MKREIKFRGKDLDTLEWRYGYYVCLQDTFRKPIDKRERVTYRIYSGIADSCASEDGYDFFEDWHDIKPETIGQSTGMFDKSGKEIFEGDFLEIGLLMGLITWHPNGYWCIHTAMKDNVQYHDYNNLGEMLDYAMLKCYDSKVIGNIHDNPELLKEE